jgi:hypothetical protein
MAEFITNPRRAPRAPARCRAAVVSPPGPFDAETEDIGPHGCQIVAPVLLRKRDALQLVVSDERLSEPLRVGGGVAWVSQRPPWRVGIAFDEAHVAASGRWFERLVAAHPEFGAFRRVPDRISVEAMVYLGAPPRFLVDFNADEAALLRAIASGARIDELRARLRAEWPAAQRALFSLLARHAVTLSRGQAVRPETWRKILSDVEASLAVESLGKGGPEVSAPAAVPVPPAPPPVPVPTATSAASGAAPAPAASAREEPSWGVPPRDPHRVIELHEQSGPPLEVATPPRGAGRAIWGEGWVGGQAAQRASATLASPPGGRSPEAHAIFQRAVSQLETGDSSGALALLRRALALAPGDREVVEALARLRSREPAGGDR